MLHIVVDRFVSLGEECAERKIFQKHKDLGVPGLFVDLEKFGKSVIAEFFLRFDGDDLVYLFADERGDKSV